MSAGILCEKQINAMIDPACDERIRLTRPDNNSFEKLQAGDASIDLCLGDRYWKMKGSCRTGSEYRVRDLIHKHAIEQGQELGEKPITLNRNTVYLFKVDCELDLKDTCIRGKSTGRSTIGRLDILVRLLVDETNAFDYIEEGGKHELYVEVTPISFPLSVKRGTALSQLRLFKGCEDEISLTKEELRHEEDKDFPVLNKEGKTFRAPCEERSDEIWFPFCLDLTPDPNTNFSAFVAKQLGEESDQEPIDPDKKNYYDPEEYWEPIKSENNTILLEPDRLYILRSKERLRIPGHLALECKSYTTQMGEWRIEYAGFAHPYFGTMQKDDKGSPIMFEVRGHNVPTILQDGIPLGNVRFMRMSQTADPPEVSASYENQELALSKCFKPWG